MSTYDSMNQLLRTLILVNGVGFLILMSLIVLAFHQIQVNEQDIIRRSAIRCIFDSKRSDALYTLWDRLAGLDQQLELTVPQANTRRVLERRQRDFLETERIWKDNPPPTCPTPTASP